MALVNGCGAVFRFSQYILDLSHIDAGLEPVVSALLGKCGKSRGKVKVIDVTGPLGSFKKKILLPLTLAPITHSAPEGRTVSGWHRRLFF